MIAADSSVLVPALIASHEAHAPCYESAGLIDAAVSHAIVETYSVLTRLPQPYTVPPAVAVDAVRSYAHQVLTLPSDQLAPLLDRLAAARIGGGAVYDAVIAATAAHHGAVLLTRDERALGIYERYGADARWVAT